MSKKHHYVPRGYLRYFSIGGKRRQVFTFDKFRGSAYPVNIADAGCENYFNTLVVAGQRIAFEPMFNLPDDALARVLRGIHEHESIQHLSGEEQELVAMLAAVQFLRTKTIRQSHEDMQRLMVGELAKRGLAVSPDEAAAMKPSAEDLKIAALQGMQMVPKLTKILLEKDWTLMRAVGSDCFTTSDTPIAHKSAIPLGASGLASPGVEVAWPLGSKLLLSMLCPRLANNLELDSLEAAEMFRGRRTLVASSDNVDYYNSMQVFWSGRFVYSDSREFRIARRALKDNPELSSQRGAEGPRSRIASSLKDQLLSPDRELPRFGKGWPSACLPSKRLRACTEASRRRPARNGTSLDRRRPKESDSQPKGDSGIKRPAHSVPNARR